eukprot:1181073-Prorocentrum_minimum.AAC.5
MWRIKRTHAHAVSSYFAFECHGQQFFVQRKTVSLLLRSHYGYGSVHRTITTFAHIDEEVYPARRVRAGGLWCKPRPGQLVYAPSLHAIGP